MTLAAKAAKPTFLSAHILGGSPTRQWSYPHTQQPSAPGREKVKLSGHKASSESEVCPWESTGRPPVGTQKQIHKSGFEHWILTQAFCLPIWKERTAWRWPFFSQAGITGRGLGKLTLISILTLRGLPPASQASAHAGASRVCPGSPWSQVAEEEESTFSLYSLFASAQLRPLYLWGVL